MGNAIDFREEIAFNFWEGRGWGQVEKEGENDKCLREERYVRRGQICLDLSYECRR
jgi:hypothetical protein